MIRPTKTNTSKATLLLILAALVWTWSLCTGCTGEDRVAAGEGTLQETVYATEADYHLHDLGDAETRKAELIADIGAAEQSIEIAVSTLADEDVAKALVAAKERGVSVRVVSDWDSRDSAGLVVLEENEIFPVYGDGELQYLPEPTLATVLGQCQEREERQHILCYRGQSGDQGAMVRPGDYNLMSHNFAIIDGYTVWNFPAFDGASTNWVGWRIESSKLAYDFLAEFKQMESGTFATTLDIYNGPVKSDTNNDITYLTDQGQMSLWFNPQERLMKLVIDRVYKSRASVWIATDNLTNPFLLDALEYKANNGFDVRIVVHPDHQAEGEAKDRLESLGVQYAADGYDSLSTLLIIDAEEDRNGDTWGREALGLSHPLLRGGPFTVEPASPSDQVFIYPADMFADGNLWMLQETGSNVHDMPLLDRFESHWLSMWEASK